VEESRSLQNILRMEPNRVVSMNLETGLLGLILVMSFNESSLEMTPDVA
jgi:hypothetical protein